MIGGEAAKQTNAAGFGIGCMSSCPCFVVTKISDILFFGLHASVMAVKLIFQKLAIGVP